MTDRHRQPRLTIRASVEQIAAWRKAAGACPLNTFVVRALDSETASILTRKLRLNKAIAGFSRSKP